jgi:hypothetical protein
MMSIDFCTFRTTFRRHIASAIHAHLKKGTVFLYISLSFSKRKPAEESEYMYLVDPIPMTKELSTHHE